MQYAKEAGHHVGTKYTMGVSRKICDAVSEKEPPGISEDKGVGCRVD